MTCASRHHLATRTLAVLSALWLLASCSSDDSAGPGAAPPTGVDGNVNKAPVVGAEVDIHRLNADGAIGAEVAGPATTDANGDWNLEVPGAETGPFVLVATGGTYVDEATGNSYSLPPGEEMYGILDLASGVTAHVTPLSHALYLGVKSQVDGGAVLATAIARAVASSQTAFGFDPSTTTPSDDAGATDEQKRYAALLGGLSGLIDFNPNLSTFVNTPPFVLMLGVVADLANGQLDGLGADGNPVLVNTDSGGAAQSPLPALSAADLSAWLIAANDYAAAHPVLNTITPFDPATDWDPSDPGTGGPGDFFSGDGTAHLSSTQFAPVLSFVDGSQSGMGNLVWIDANDVQVRVFPNPADPSEATTASVVNHEIPGRTWIAFSINGLTGVTISGGKVTFDGTDALDESVTGDSQLFLNGVLEEPTDTLAPPPAPTGAIASGLDSAIQVSWNAVTEADSYNLYIAREAGVTPGNWPALAGGQMFENVTSPFTTPATLSPGQAHYAVVTGVNPSGEGPHSAETTATPTGAADPGSLTFSGTGVGSLDSPSFRPTSAGPGGHSPNLLQHWVDFTTTNVAASVLFGTGASSKLVTQVYVANYDMGWWASDPAGVPGTSYSSGSVSFTGVVLDEFPGKTQLTLDGSLNSISLDGAVGMHGSITLSGPDAPLFPDTVFSPDAAQVGTPGTIVRWTTMANGMRLHFTNAGVFSWDPHRITLGGAGSYMGDANAANGVTLDGTTWTFVDTAVGGGSVIINGSLKY